jgi:hypothetical protein
MAILLTIGLPVLALLFIVGVVMYLRRDQPQ